MRCPRCGSVEDKVIDSRPSKEGESIRRRRECLCCERRFTTYEEIEQSELLVVKGDGRHELFDRYKLQGSLLRACEKRPVSIKQITQCIEEITQDLEAGQGQEISTKAVGAKVMEKLRILDPIAYVRYASTYRQFQGIGDFIKEIKSLEGKGARASARPELFGT
ncbi:Transcriptional repressor NrdR [Candidatus Xiphinematobacter sp. Idaho Grape]|uniref:transcriptional regulator NrdR n=1 Tax=Candidatus Xiphinematobacter sp. Idaho Grape TaxID=1704307 RepID=UPI0007060B2F|nr:transcriptional regulator NrdR [Candidatus Xiphinematobacter sp. Idaho Grape]ALJ56627.1 Transcriptional repressor NrdR [Candidatus Xiphinematobacter sp. Idaho Grape]